MRAVPSTLLASLVTLSLGCSDATAPRELPDPPDLQVTIAPASATIRGGESMQFTASVKRGAAFLSSESTANWFSSDASVATVTSGGIVRGIRGGVTEITAVWGNSRATAQVTVLDETMGGGKHNGCLKPLLVGATPIDRSC
jgi:hypothetical protein